MFSDGVHPNLGGMHETRDDPMKPAKPAQLRVESADRCPRIRQQSPRFGAVRYINLYLALTLAADQYLLELLPPPPG
jgi:hypothetical protein